MGMNLLVGVTPLWVPVGTKVKPTSWVNSHGVTLPIDMVTIYHFECCKVFCMLRGLEPSWEDGVTQVSGCHSSTFLYIMNVG